MEPSELQRADDARRVSDILQFTTESTPPPKSDDAAETNGSSKQTRKSKRPQWLTVGVIQHCYHTHTHTRLMAISGTTQVSRYHKGKTNLDFPEARASEWQWHQLGHMQVCTLLRTDNNASTPRLSFLQAGCPSCCPTNSIKALKAILLSLHVKMKAALKENDNLFV